MNGDEKERLRKVEQKVAEHTVQVRALEKAVTTFGEKLDDLVKTVSKRGGAIGALLFIVSIVVAAASAWLGGFFRGP
jgi:hypothetical protein